MSRHTKQWLRILGAGTLVFLVAAFINTSSCSPEGRVCTTVFGGVSYMLALALMLGYVYLAVYQLHFHFYTVWLRFAVPYIVASMLLVVLFWDYRLFVAGLCAAGFFLASSVIIRRTMDD